MWVLCHDCLKKYIENNKKQKISSFFYYSSPTLKLPSIHTMNYCSFSYNFSTSFRNYNFLSKELLYSLLNRRNLTCSSNYNHSCNIFFLNQEFIQCCLNRREKTILDDVSISIRSNSRMNNNLKTRSSKR